MNKEELQKEIDKANLDIDATNQRISKLREEIAEAEPKLRHGDFGIDTDDECGSFIVMEQSTLFGTPKAFFENQSGRVKADESMSSNLRLGNIFDLLKNDEFLELIATLKRKQS